MSVNRETIEIQVSGLSQLNQLESTLLRALGAADALSDAVGRVGGSLESATGRFTQTAQIERALRRTRRVAQQSLVDPRSRRVMGSAGVRRRQADVENMSAEISELRERRRQERLDIAERRRRIANLSRRSAQRRQEAQAADRRLQAQERRILEVNDQMTGQVSEARLGSRTERSRTLIRRRQLDAQRLRTSGLYNTGELGRAANALEGRYEALNREILDLERAETVLRDSAQGVIRSLQRRRAQATTPALQQEIQRELATVRSDLTRQLNTFQSQRQQLATNYGGLNEERRSINRIGRGRSVTFRAAESLNARADLLRNLYGASRDDTRVTLGRDRVQISEATRRAIEQANAGNTEAAKDILGFASRRLTALEREINNTNKLADAEQRRLQIVQKLEDRFQQLRTANASGGNFREFERLLDRVRELSGTRNMPLFNRIAAQASAAAGRVAIPKGFMRGPSSPIGGATFIPGSEKNIAARDIGSLTIEGLQQRLETSRRPGQPSFAFQRAESIIGRLQPLANANKFRQFDSLVKQARKALGIVASENKSIADATAARTRDEKEIEKITKKVLSGKRLEASEVDRLNALRPPASALPALPAAAPGAAALGGRARPLRTQSTVGGVVQPLIQEILGGGRTIEDAELSKRFADSFATKAGKKAGPKFAQVFVAGAADSFSAKQLLSGIGAAFGVLSEKSLSKTASQAVKLESGIAGVADALVNAAKANESVERAAARAAAVQAGLYDDSDLKQFVEGLLQTEKVAGDYLDKLKQTFSFQDKQRKADEKGNTARKAALEAEDKRLSNLRKSTRAYEKNISAISEKLLTGKTIKPEESARLLAFNRATGTANLPALPPGNPALAQFRGGARERRGVTPISTEILGGARTADQAQMALRLIANQPIRGGRGGGAPRRSTGPRPTDPQAAQQRLARDLFAGESLVGKLQNLERKRVAGLGAADPKTVEVTQQVVKLETQLNAAKQAGFELTKQNLDALTSTVNKSRQLLELDAQQNKLSAETAKIRRLQGERRLPQLQRDSLTSILGDLGRASSAAKVFRGGRSGEQALSNIIGAFNASTAPPKASPLTPGPTAPRYTGPDAGREMEIDRYRGIFAGLTNNPRFYNRLLQGLPREAITTTMAGRASDISKAVEDAKRPDRKALESSIRLAYEEAVGNIPSAVTELFDKIGSVFDSIVNRVKGGAGGVGGTGGGGKPPLPPAAGGPEPGDFAGRVDAARGSADKLLGLKDLADMSGASIKQLQLLSQALSETREGVKMTDKSFGQLTKVLNKVDDQIARRDTGADFLTRQFGQRRGQAIGEGLIGGAFPLLFGQGLGAAAGGGLGGALGGFAGGTLGFGLSLAGTALGSAFDGVVQAAQDTGNTLRDLVGNFEQIKDSGLLASRSQEKLIETLLEAGNKTAAYAIIQDELNQKIGADGAAKLREAADAGDRMKRAMGDLGVQVQLFVAGPLTAFLNKLSGGFEKLASKNRFAGAFESAPQDAQKAALAQLDAEIRKQNKSGSSYIQGFLGKPGQIDLAKLLFGGVPEQSLIGADVYEKLTASLLRSSAKGPEKQTPEQQRQQAINDAETLQAAAQRELDVFTKTNESADILKGFKQQASAIRREQEDIDRQSFELRRDYEKQIEDIRRGVEDKISQLRQENAQKELEILVKQGQIREQQFKNAALAIQNELAGDDLAQSLADAVTTYLGAQLSAQNEIEQRRKQFEIEIGNQQIELEKYKADVARSVAQLNLSTAEKVQEINRGIARRNEDAALNNFAAEKESAKLKLRVLAAELRVLQTKEQTEIEQTRANIQNNPSLREQYILIETAQKKRLQEFENGIERINKKILPEVEGIKPPAKLSEVGAVSTKGVSTAGVSDLVARGTQLQRQILNLSDSLTRINQQGGLEEFIGRITGLAQQSFTELENALNRSRKALGLAGDDFSITQQLIESSYEDLIRSLAKNPEISLTAELLGLLNAAEKTTIELEKIRPTIEFYTQANEQAASSISQTKAEIAGLLLPVKEYDRQLAIINSRGGLGVNPEQEQEILRNAKALDELNAKLKALNALRDVASGWTDSFIQLNKELLKGGNLLESVQRFAEGVADRTLDVLLEFTLRPLQDQLFKNLADFIGIKPEQDPLLQPINAVKNNTDKILEAATSLVRAAQAAVPTTQAAPAAPANGIRPGPGAISEPPGNYQWYREGDRVGGPSSSAAPMGQFNGIGGPDLPMTGRSIKEALRLTDEEIAAAVNTAIGEYGGSDPLGRTDVFANILSRSRSGRYPSNLVDVVTQPGQYAPNFGLSRAQVINPNRYGADLFNRVKSELLDPALLERSIKDVNGRLYFKGISQYGNMMQGDFLRAEGQNFFHGPGRESGLNPQITSKLLSEIRPVATMTQPEVQFNAEVRQEEWLGAFRAGRKEIGAAFDLATTASGEAAVSIDRLAQSADQAATGLEGVGTTMSESVTKFQQIVGTGLQAISSVAMGVGGAQMIRKGGTYNTLMGAASIFGSIGSVAGMFGTGGPLSGLFGGGKPAGRLGFGATAKGLPLAGLPAYASGGRPEPFMPALIGEEGPELWVPDRPGTIIPNDELYVPGLDDKGGSAPPIGRYSRRAAANPDTTEGSSERSVYSETYERGPGSTTYVGNYGRSVPYQRSETTREIDRLERVTSSPKELPPIKYETTRVNEYEFVTPEQLEASNARTAKIARNQTIRELADSMKTRKRLGL